LVIAIVVPALFVLVLDGCQDGAGSLRRLAPLDESLDGLDVSLEAVGGGGEALPKALRLLVRNPSDRPVRFVAPGPFCFAMTEGDRKIRFPVLGIVFRDAEGRESDMAFGPVYADLEAKKPPTPTEVSLGSGGIWSHYYPMASFQFFGPCGPAGDVGALLQSGEVRLDLALEIIEFHHREGPPAIDREKEAPQQSKRRTNAIAVRVKKAPKMVQPKR
jgi:hypothetical protein